MKSYPATLFCVVAVYNRCETTRHFLERLRRQRGVNIQVIVVDDGSSDGTNAMLAQFIGLKLQVLAGSGNLWWGGAMRLGMQAAAKQMQTGDALLLLNDDTDFADDFLRRFADRAHELGPAVVIGCQQRAAENGEEASFGYRIDYRHCWIEELLEAPNGERVTDVDALCGRGMLISREVIERVGFPDAANFPHYLGDIEYSARAKDFGVRLVCDPTISVSTSFLASDRGRVANNHWRRFFSKVSSKNLIQHYKFWSLRGPKFLTRTAAVRFPVIKLSRAVRALSLKAFARS